MLHEGQKDFKQYSTYGKWRLQQYKNWNLCLQKAHLKYKYMKTAATKKPWNLNKTSVSTVCVMPIKINYGMYIQVCYLSNSTPRSAELIQFCYKSPDFQILPKISFVHRTTYVSGNITIFWDIVRTFKETVLCPSSGSSRCHWGAGIHLANYTVP